MTDDMHAADSRQRFRTVPPTLSYALRLVERGIPCFFCAGNKRPTSLHGFKDAAASEPELLKLWCRHPGPLIGVPTGAASGISVLDLDFGKHEKARTWFAENEPKLPQTRTHATRSGGLHLLFKHLLGVKNSEGLRVLGVDTRGTGGYIIWWPLTISEVRCKGPLAPWPQWISEWLWPPPPPRQAPILRHPLRPGAAADRAQNIMSRVLYRLEAAPEGQRHYRLRAAACTIGGLIDALRISTSDAERVLVDAAVRAGAEDRANAERTAKWGIERGRQTPLRVGARR